jgi:glucose-1-phosphate cytidylyltransferase
MKVVLFCGGQGMRLREFSEQIPKPMIKIGYRPILWHLMKYYAHFGHKDFILCLGYQADVIKEYFLNYDECLSNDFVLTGDRSNVKLLNCDIHDWRITFVDTGMTRNIGGRLMAVKEHLQGEETFLANYSDNLTDLNLPDMIDDFSRRDRVVASFLCVRPSQSFHIVSLNGDGQVHGIEEVAKSDVRINGGYFILRKEIFDYIKPGEELVMEPFQRLIAEKRLYAYKYDEFWAAMDTFKEKQKFDEMYARGEAPWKVWSAGSNPVSRGPLGR